MKIILCIFLFLVTHMAYAQCPSVSNEVDLMIKEHASKVRGGEYCRFRTTFVASNIELVLYTIEGPCYKGKSLAGSCGNHYFRSLVGIINGKKYPSIVVGGKGVFHTKDISYENGIIKIKGKAYKRTDAMCCPSIEEEHQYKVGVESFEKIKP